MRVRTIVLVIVIAAIMASLIAVLREPPPLGGGGTGADQQSVQVARTDFEAAGLRTPAQLSDPNPDGGSEKLGPLVLMGRVARRDGQPIATTTMFVHSPRRGTLSKDLLHRSQRQIDLPKDGGFRIELPRDAYDRSALVNIVGPPANATLFTGLVELGAEAEILVNGPEDDSLKPLQGGIELRGGVAEAADLLILQATDKAPITFQRELTGSELLVTMPVCKRSFADVAGPVLLLLDDQEGLHVQVAFQSMQELTRRLADRLVVDLQATRLIVPDLDGHPAEFVEVAASDNDRMRKRHPVHGGVVELKTTPGRIVVHGFAEIAGRRAFTRVVAAPGDVVAKWGFVAPGLMSQEIVVLDGDQKPLANASTSWRLMRPRSPGTVPGLFSWAGQSGSDGVVRAAGLHDGEYRVEVTHPHCVTRTVLVDVPANPMKVTLAHGATIAWEITCVGRVGIPGGILVLHRHESESMWKLWNLGVEAESHDYTQPGVPVGSVEFVLVSGDFVGHRKMQVAGDSVISVRLEAPPVCTVRVESSTGPKPGLWVEVTADIEGQKAILGALTDANGECRFPTLPIQGCVARIFDANREILGTTSLGSASVVRVP